MTEPPSVSVQYLCSEVAAFTFGCDPWTAFTVKSAGKVPAVTFTETGE